MTREAVALHRRLAGNHARSVPQLAILLGKLGFARRTLGYADDAVALMWESVGLMRPLAEQNPSVYTEQVGRVLVLLGGALRDLGRWDEAAAATREAVAIWRRLERAHPGRYSSGLHATLNALGRALRPADNPHEELILAREALDIARRQHGTTNLTRHEHELVNALFNYSAVLSQIGRWEETLTASEEAVQRCDRLRRVDPMNIADHAKALLNYAIALMQVGRIGDAKHYAQLAGLKCVLWATRHAIKRLELPKTTSLCADLLDELGKRWSARRLRIRVQKLIDKWNRRAAG